MRRWIAVAVVMVSLHGRYSSGHEQLESSLVVKKNWVRFDLVLGRITATQTKGGRHNCTQSTGDAATRRELLSIVGDSKSPAVRYELADSTQRLTVEVIRHNEVFVLREPQPGSSIARLQFLQPREGDIKIQLGDPERGTSNYSAASIWHLLLAEPDLCRHELLPILRLLRPHWQLMESASQIEMELFRAAMDAEGLAVADVRKLVEALGSPRFVDRQHADRQLRGCGVAVLTHFKQLDRASLSREQRQRIDRIKHDLAVIKADSPERIVAWLLNDEAVWLSMLAREDVIKRQVAAARLSAIHPDASKFDPFAEEAQRRAQIDVLRLRISSRR